MMLRGTRAAGRRSASCAFCLDLQHHKPLRDALKTVLVSGVPTMGLLDRHRPRQRSAVFEEFVAGSVHERHEQDCQIGVRLLNRADSGRSKACRPQSSRRGPAGPTRAVAAAGRSGWRPGP